VVVTCPLSNSIGRTKKRFFGPGLMRFDAGGGADATPDRPGPFWGGAYLATCPYLLSDLKCQVGRFECRVGRFERKSYCERAPRAPADPAR
jgi:hypothetical protein